MHEVKIKIDVFFIKIFLYMKKEQIYSFFKKKRGYVVVGLITGINRKKKILLLFLKLFLILYTIC